MSNFKQMWIPCTEAEYPEVKQLLEGMGLNRVYDEPYEYRYNCTGVVTYLTGQYQAARINMFKHPTVTLPELRVMANEVVTVTSTNESTKTTDDREELRLLIQRVGIMERSIMGMETKINEIHDLLFKE